jgi:serine protease Do
MNRSLPRWCSWRLAGLGLVLALVVPGFAATRDAGPTIWTERPVTTNVAMVQVPSWVELAKHLKPAVVNVSTRRAPRDGEAAEGDGSEPLDRYFGQLFGDETQRTVRSLGSGFIINPDGFIVTNNHVVDGATEIRITLSDGRDFPAKVIGRDPKTDLALLRIAATGLPVVPLGDSSVLAVGEPVMAIGNPFGLEQTVTTGIISATGRVIGEGPYDDFVQTDAAINPGNSGGPLIDTRGRAIGINTAILSQTGGSVGIGFAIPISLAKPVIGQLASNGRVVRGWLGVAVQPVSAELAQSFGFTERRGALVASVVTASPAMKAGIRAGDVITEYDGVKIARANRLARVVADTAVGREVPLIVVRDGKSLRLIAKITQLAEASGRVSPASRRS